jgi:hypothetical protein
MCDNHEHRGPAASLSDAQHPVQCMFCHMTQQPAMRTHKPEVSVHAAVVAALKRFKLETCALVATLRLCKATLRHQQPAACVHGVHSMYAQPCSSDRHVCTATHHAKPVQLARGEMHGVGS